MARYIVADAIPFPEMVLKQDMPDIHALVTNLADKAGCPFEWAFLLLLPVVCVVCSRARLWINELFLVPPLLWIGLALDSDANKSGIMSALSDIISAYEKTLLNAEMQKASAQIANEPDADEAEEDDAGEHDDTAEEAPAPKSKRKLRQERAQLAKRKKQILQDPPCIVSDEGSLPAVGMQMSTNGNRCVGLYDEGNYLLRAFREGNVFNPSTMSKLFNGSVWKRKVVKDHNCFYMRRTLLSLAMSLHIEEWDEFLAKDADTLGLTSRIMLFHSQPRLEFSEHVLDARAKRVVADSAARQQPDRSDDVVKALVECLECIDQAHQETAEDYDDIREMIPYFFSQDALAIFRKHWDQQVIAQEMSYLFDPKKFSLCSKLKSLPWRLALVLHNLSLGDQKKHASEWSRHLSAKSVSVSISVFDYLYQQSQCLSPRCNLPRIIHDCSLATVLTQKYPSLYHFAMHGPEAALDPNFCSSSSSAHPLPADLSNTEHDFDAFWSGLDLDGKTKAVQGAYWVKALDFSARHSHIFAESYK